MKCIIKFYNMSRLFKAYPYNQHNNKIKSAYFNKV